eukprot:scaffold127578_cov69-Phaeocystis_antarctica.AAC.7
MSTSTARPLTRFVVIAVTWSEAFVHSRPSCSWSGQANTRLHSSSAAATCVVPRYTVRTARPRLVRVRRTYSAAPPKASYPGLLVRTARRTSGTRSLYGGFGTYVSAQVVTSSSSHESVGTAVAN